MSAPLPNTPDALRAGRLEQAVTRLADDLPEAVFSGTPLADAPAGRRARTLLLSHQATQREADRIRSALAETCGVSREAPALDLALSPEVAPAEGAKLLVAAIAQDVARDLPPPAPRTVPDLARRLSGGQAQGALRVTTRAGDTEVTMMLVDAELDPVSITFDIDGNASIHADGATHACLSPGQLELVAERSADAIRTWEELIAREGAGDAVLADEGAA